MRRRRWPSWVLVVVAALFVAGALLYPDAVYPGWRPIDQF